MNNNIEFYRLVINHVRGDFKPERRILPLNINVVIIYRLVGNPFAGFYKGHLVVNRCQGRA